MRLEWKEYFMALAKLAATRSGCNSRPTGAVIVINNRVIATGYNGSLPGQLQCTDSGKGFCVRRSIERDDSGEKKYRDCISIHAEQNAINQLAVCGGDPKGADLYCTLFPCIHCLKNMASVGIRRVYYEMPYESDDSERDKYWLERAAALGLEVERVILSPRSVKEITSNMSGFTSFRRLL